MVEGTTTIISIVPEGTIVEKGDVVIELDSSTLREKAKQQEITVTQAEAGLAQAIESLEIQKKQNESDIAAAKLKWSLAKLDLIKFEEGEYPQQEKQLSGNVALAEEDLLRAQENLEFTNEQVKKGYRTQNDREAARIAVKQAELKLQGAREELKVLQQFTYRRTIEELKANSEELERELARTELKARAAQTQFEKDVEARRLTYEVEKERYDQNLTQIEACTMRATQNGEVVYANIASGGRSSREPISIEEGATVRERQAIINLPDVTQMKVDCRIHESLIGSVRKGLPARVRIDAYPGQYFNGVVATVSSVPMSGSWPNTDLREYSTEIHLTDEIEKIRKLRPGLTAQVEILVSNRSNILQAPVQSIVTIGGRQVAYVVNARGFPELRDLLLGESNQSHVEIKDGIEAGEMVVMNPRSRFAKELADLEAGAAGDSPDDMSQMEVPAAEALNGSRLQTSDGAETTSRASSTTPTASGGAGPPEPATLISRLDKDGDGMINREEASEQLKARFDEIDTNKDGKISRDELSAAPRRRPNG